jgi:hypothetical protein
LRDALDAVKVPLDARPRGSLEIRSASLYCRGI